jgi:hypothetical protein
MDYVEPPSQPTPDPLRLVLTRLAVISDQLRELHKHSPQRQSQPGVYLTAKEAAVFLNIPYSTFRKKAVKIRRQPGTGRYLREDLAQFAASLRSNRKRAN